ncbi:carbohydrate ABC transporter permease [Streptacidiphilus sp. EB129]|uniref:carbohydrate ABC transporter permease n=1 Tax=Streptacidiphilus sp. EB129 TaxID=3156262 RepID=UPI0035183486
MSTTLRTPPPGRTRTPGAGASRRRRGRGLATAFVLPALLLLGALVVYPIVYSVVRSTFDSGGSHFIGLGNYRTAFRDPATLTALRNNAIWVAVAPALVTAIGLVFAVLTERVRWGTAFKLLVFMPMAISFLAAGIIFRLVYDQDPQQGVLNAVVVAVHDTFAPPSPYPGVHPREDNPLVAADDGSARISVDPASPGGVLLPLLGVAPTALPRDARPAAIPAAGSGSAVDGVAFLDFVPGGGGRPGVPGPGKKGLPGLTVQLLQNGRKVGTATTAADGTFHLARPSGGGPMQVVLPASDFAQPYQGVSWLGPTLVTPAVIGAYIWIWAGFAMVVIGAGLANLPRDTLEAARIDGASEWQVFRRITVPQLAPVLGVVFVTMVINVMKVFDLVFIIAPQPVQQNADVLALQLWLDSFGGADDQGLGSALGVLLLLLVVPFMVLNIRRFRRRT